MSSLLSTFRDDFSALRSETCFCSTLRAETIGMRANASSFRAIREFFKAILCSFRISVRSALFFRKDMA